MSTFSSVESVHRILLARGAPQVVVRHAGGRFDVFPASWSRRLAGIEADPVWSRRVVGVFSPEMSLRALRCELRG